MDPEDEEEVRKSRSQLKREFEEIKELVKEVVGLSPAQLKTIPLSEHTLDAAVAAQSMSRAALTRQLRYVAGLMQDEDLEAVRGAVSDVQQQHRAGVGKLHAVERWRDELLSGDEQALGRLLEAHPGLDRQHLNQLVRNARKERELGKAPASARQLFRYLKSVISDG